MVYLIHRQLAVGVYRVGYRGVRDPGGYVHLSPRGGHVHRERPLAPASLSPQRVAGRLELRGGEERGDDVELHQLHFLLVGEGVEGSGFEAEEGGIRRGEDGEALLRVVELRLDLVGHFCVL